MPKSWSLCTACGRAVCVEEQRQRKGGNTTFLLLLLQLSGLLALLCPKKSQHLPSNTTQLRALCLSLQDHGQEHSRNQGEKIVGLVCKAEIKIFCCPYKEGKLLLEILPALHPGVL